MNTTEYSREDIIAGNALLDYALKGQLKRRGRNVVCLCPFRRNKIQNEYRWHIVVIIDESPSDVALAARGVHDNAVVGHARCVDTAVFARLSLPGSQLLAADFVFRLPAPPEEEPASPF